ncbi:hypothetical protein CPB85DRAFT_269017 [Mucidula mucida]|nr:hypothetical protein CPB85DRAFT_269017 [Mucidula mucida]
MDFLDPGSDDESEIPVKSETRSTATYPSLLGTSMTGTSVRAVTPVLPVPAPAARSISTPKGSDLGEVSISTPPAASQTTPPEWESDVVSTSIETSRTPTPMPSRPSGPSRDMFDDLDRLRHQVEEYDTHRMQENDDIADALRNIQENLQRLSTMVDQPRPPSVPSVQRQRDLVARSVGGSSSMSMTPTTLEIPYEDAFRRSADLSRASSMNSSMSFLSSPFSLREERQDSPIPWEVRSVSSPPSSSSSSSSSSSTSSPPRPSTSSPSSSSASKPSTEGSTTPRGGRSPSPTTAFAMPQSPVAAAAVPSIPIPVPEHGDVLQNIRDDLARLMEEQRRLADLVQSRPDADNGPVLDRLRGLENLL